MSRTSGPHPLCVGKCNEFQVSKPQHGKRYEVGQKRCQMCERWVMYEGIWCPCCHHRLRTSPKCKRSEKSVVRI